MKRSFDILRRLWCWIVGHDQWSYAKPCCGYWFEKCRRCGKVWSGKCFCAADRDTNNIVAAAEPLAALGRRMEAARREVRDQSWDGEEA